MANSPHLGVEREAECSQKVLSMISKSSSAQQCDLSWCGISRYMNRNLFSKRVKGVLQPHKKKKKKSHCALCSSHVL